MHALLERFTTISHAQRTLTKGARRHALDPFEQALFTVAQRTPKWVELLGDEDEYQAVAALGLMALEAATEVVLADGRLGPHAQTARAAMVAAGVADEEALAALGCVLEEEAYARPTLPGSFDAEWVEEGLRTLARVAVVSRRAFEGRLERWANEESGSRRSDRRVLAGALAEELFRDGPTLFSREVIGRALQSVGDEIAEPEQEGPQMAELVEKLAGEGWVGPRRLPWLLAALVPAEPHSSAA